MQGGGPAMEEQSGTRPVATTATLTHGEPWAGSREGNSRNATLGRVWVELGAGHVGGRGEHCRG